LEEKEEEYSEEIGKELAAQIVSSKDLQKFESFKEEFDARLIANFFTNLKANLEDKGIEIDNLDESELGSIFSALENEEIQKGDLADVIQEMKDRSPEDAIEEVVSNKTDESEIRKIIQEVLDEKSDMVEEQGMRAQGPLMGVLQQKVEADGSTISQILQEELEEKIN